MGQRRAGELKVQSRICIEADGRAGEEGDRGAGREIKMENDCQRARGGPVC